MKRIAILLLPLALALSACMTVARMEGDQLVNDRLLVHVSSAWNKVSDPWEVTPYDTWTQEGIPLDHLRFWGGLHPGQPLMVKLAVFSRAEDAKAPRVPSFRRACAEKAGDPFEEIYATGHGEITKVEPSVRGQTACA